MSLRWRTRRRSRSSRVHRLLREAHLLLEQNESVLPQTPWEMSRLIDLILTNQVVTQEMEDGVVIQRMTPGDLQTATLLHDATGWMGHLSSAVQTGWQRVDTPRDLAEILSDITAGFVTTALVNASLRILR